MSRLHLVPYGSGTLDVEGGGFELLVDALAETYDQVVLAVPSETADTGLHATRYGDLGILLVTADTDPVVIDDQRATLHRSGVPSVYVVDVAELGPGRDRQSVAA